MDDRLKELMKKLGNAINESLSESDRIAESIGEIRRAGYDIFLVLEATIGFNQREDDILDKEEDDEIDSRYRQSPQPSPPPKAAEPTTFKWTTQDNKFLKQLHIAPDDPNTQ